MGVVGPLHHLVTSILSAIAVGTIVTVARAWGAGAAPLGQADLYIEPLEDGQFLVSGNARRSPLTTWYPV